MHMATQLNVRYVHNIMCIHLHNVLTWCIQVLKNPRNMLGFGFGHIWRLWLYLRRFSAMTEEMRPAHQIDVLTHALLYYGRCTAENIGKCILITYDSITKFNKYLYDAMI